MTARTCRCGCGASLDGRRRDCVFATSTCAREYARGESAAQRGKTVPGGEQLSYSKTFRNLIEDLAEFVEVHRIEVSLRRSLPARQKQRLEARGR